MVKGRHVMYDHENNIDSSVVPCVCVQDVYTIQYIAVLKIYDLIPIDV